MSMTPEAATAIADGFAAAAEAAAVVPALAEKWGFNAVDTNIDLDAPDLADISDETLAALIEAFKDCEPAAYDVAKAEIARRGQQDAIGDSPANASVTDSVTAPVTEQDDHAGKVWNNHLQAWVSPSSFKPSEA